MTTNVSVQGEHNLLHTRFCHITYLTAHISGVSLFLPTIIAALYPGLPTVQVQLRTVPPYMVAFVWGLAVAYLSNRINQRGWVMLASSPFAIAGESSVEPQHESQSPNSHGITST